MKRARISNRRSEFSKAGESAVIIPEKFNFKTDEEARVVMGEYIRTHFSDLLAGTPSLGNHLMGPRK